MSDAQYRDRLDRAVAINEGLEAIITRQQQDLLRLRSERDVLAQRLDRLLDELTLRGLQRASPPAKLHVA